MIDDSDFLEAVFGKESVGLTPFERARTSRVRFVRSQHQLSQYRDNATGRVLNAPEALRIYGWGRLRELADRPATPVICDSTEPYQTIRRQLDQMGLQFESVARKVRWSKDSIQRFEQRKQVPFRDLVRMAQAINLDEELLGTVADAGADRELGVRLRTLKSRDPSRFTANTVLGLAEAAWTIQKQYTLASLINESGTDAINELGFSTSNDFGNRLSPTYRKGYDLAHQTRELLGIGSHEPIDCLKELIETRLRIPVIQLELDSPFAGATVASGSHRGIVVNLRGENERPLFRRMTLAHELGHLLWDPDQVLQKLVVDRYDQIAINAMGSSALDHVERRANAFAIEFLAPSDSIAREFDDAGRGVAGLVKIIAKFGVSRTAIARHLANIGQSYIDVVQERIPEMSLDDWEGRESLAVPVFEPQEVPVSRRGRFSYYVLKAYEANLISNDTAASLYGCDVRKIDVALRSTRQYVV